MPVECPKCKRQPTPGRLQDIGLNHAAAHGNVFGPTTYFIECSGCMYGFEVKVRLVAEFEVVKES